VEVEDRFHNLLSSHTVEEFSDHYHRERVAGRYNQQSQVEDILKPYFTQVKTTGRSLTVEPQPDLGLLRRRLIAPIMVENELLGYLLLLSKSNNFTRLVVQATEHAALIYALLMMKEKSQAEVERRLQTDFLEELISGASNLNVELMNQRGHYLGFNPGAAYLFVMVDIDDFADVILRLSWCETYVRSFKREFYAVVSREVNLLFKESLVVSKGDSLLILAKVTEEKSETEQTRLLISAIQCSISTLSLDKSLTISIAVGGVCHNLTDYPQVARQSNLCLELLKVIGRKGQVVSYKDLGLYTILLERQNKEVLLDFASSQLRNLMEYDREHEGALVNTLRAYLANDKRLKETAAACNIHVNGLRYRMQRIEEVGQFSLDDPEICFNLQLALKILEIEKMFAI
jgi:sugar diacid utilization regulator